MSPSIGYGDERRRLFAGDHAAVCAFSCGLALLRVQTSAPSLDRGAARVVGLESI